MIDTYFSILEYKINFVWSPEMLLYSLKQRIRPTLRVSNFVLKDEFNILWNPKKFLTLPTKNRKIRFLFYSPRNEPTKAFSPHILKLVERERSN